MGTIVNDVKDKCRDIVVEELGIDADKVHDEAYFYDDLGADSLDMVELVMAVEDDFDIEIPDYEAEKVVTFRQMHELVTIKLRDR